VPQPYRAYSGSQNGQRHLPIASFCWRRATAIHANGKFIAAVLFSVATVAAPAQQPDKPGFKDPALDTAQALKQAALEEADEIAEWDVGINKAIAINAQPLVPHPAVIIHHCNTGSLATIDYGTAVGIIRMAHELGKQVLCLVEETRPRLQAARLTAWELQQYAVPSKVIIDGASGHFMRTPGVDLVTVGCDRVVANGDTANKIGTYNLALAARAHGVPFYMAAHTTTVDMDTPSGDQIVIEERRAREVTHVGECQITPDGGEVANPAFDVTLAEYISAIITEKGVVRPPFKKNLAKLMGR
jgi:methylthioribose-1-phosphate isomerase